MKPLHRRGFILATLGCILAAVLVVAIVANSDARMLALQREVGMARMVNLLLIGVLATGLFSLGLYGWFAARRFTALMTSRWPAALPVTFWVVGCIVLITVLQVFDRTLVDPDTGFGPIRTDGPGELEEAMHHDQIRQYAAIISLALWSLAIVTAAWCAVRALVRDPVPVEDHFA